MPPGCAPSRRCRSRAPPAPHRQPPTWRRLTSSRPVRAASRRAPRWPMLAGVPKCGLMPTPENANSLMLVCPTSTPPAWRTRATAGLSCAGDGGIVQRRRCRRRGETGYVVKIFHRDRCTSQRTDRRAGAVHRLQRGGTGACRLVEQADERLVASRRGGGLERLAHGGLDRSCGPTAPRHGGRRGSGRARLLQSAGSTGCVLALAIHSWRAARTVSVDQSRTGPQKVSSVRPSIQPPAIRAGF